jgi:AcrR family transcriptional regulator
MPRAPATTPRKSASQERSRLTVEALLEATARILVKQGYDRASTNRIAALAGVSVGSLYQYFPSKEALVAAVVARHNREMLDVLRTALEAVASQPLPVALRTLVGATIEAHQVDPALHRIFAEQVPRMGQLAEIERLQRETAALIRSYLEARRAELAIADLDIATFICVSTVETLAHEYVIRHPHATAAQQDGFVDEVTRMVLGYLRGDAPRRDPECGAPGQRRARVRPPGRHPRSAARARQRPTLPPRSRSRLRPIRRRISPPRPIRPGRCQHLRARDGCDGPSSDGRAARFSGFRSARASRLRAGTRRARR